MTTSRFLMLALVVACGCASGLKSPEALTALVVSTGTYTAASPSMDVREVRPTSDGKLFAVQNQQIVFWQNVTAGTSISVRVRDFRNGDELIYFVLLQHPAEGPLDIKFPLPHLLRPEQKCDPGQICDICRACMRCCPSPYWIGPP